MTPQQALQVVATWIGKINSFTIDQAEQAKQAIIVLRDAISPDKPEDPEKGNTKN